jgi:photosystem II stability/assembly factor-like uncharacterized protein
MSTCIGGLQFLFFRTFLVLLLIVFLVPAKIGAQTEFITQRDSLYSVTVVGREHAWIVGYWGKIFHTADGGKSWELQPSGTDIPLCSVKFVTRDQGIITGREGIILRTNDGGKTWVKMNSGTTHHLLSVTYTDPHDIWAVGDFGTIIHSRDGGDTWKDISLNTWPPEQLDTFLRPEENPDLVLNRVYFYDSQHGWIIGEFAHILHTTDGGLTWQPQENFVEEIPTNTYWYDIKFRDLEKGAIVGLAGTIYTTEDGGQSWKQSYSTNRQTLFTLGMGREDFTFGSVGTALEFSKNPENGWHTIKDIESINWFRDVAFSSDGKIGWVVGGSGTIYKTDDGGDTWQQLFPPIK